jgi:hypothetical protein
VPFAGFTQRLAEIVIADRLGEGLSSHQRNTDLLRIQVYADPAIVKMSRSATYPPAPLVQFLQKPWALAHVIDGFLAFLRLPFEQSITSCSSVYHPWHPKRSINSITVPMSLSARDRNVSHQTFPRSPIAPDDGL